MKQQFQEFDGRWAAPWRSLVRRLWQNFRRIVTEPRGRALRLRGNAAQDSEEVREDCATVASGAELASEAKHLHADAEAAMTRTLLTLERRLQKQGDVTALAVILSERRHSQSLLMGTAPPPWEKLVFEEGQLWYLRAEELPHHIEPDC